MNINDVNTKDTYNIRCAATNPVNSKKRYMKPVSNKQALRIIAEGFASELSFMSHKADAGALKFFK